MYPPDKKTRHLVSAMLGACEHKGAINLPLFEQVRQKAILIFTVNEQNLLVYDFNRR